MRRAVISCISVVRQRHQHRELLIRAMSGGMKGYTAPVAAVTVGSDAKVIDIRSDTVTKPSAAMYEAMVSAPVGDDIYEEDPTVKELQRRCAKLFNMEDSLFVPSGTMGNLICLMTHCTERGQEIILGKKNHIFLYEAGGTAQVAGIHINTLDNKPDGTIDLDEVRENIRDLVDTHMPHTKVICLENTQNRCGGLVIPVSYFESVRKLANEHNLKVHLDGARIMNAATSAGVEPSVYTSLVDSVNMCFSKGLGAPVGSIIAGSSEFCRMAKRNRKMLGGGLRQVGVLAAAALYALDNNISKLKQDHQNAGFLAQVAADHGGKMASMDMTSVQSNIVFMYMNKPEIINSHKFVARMLQVTEEEKSKLGEEIIVKMSAFSNTAVRFVCHLDVSQQDIVLVAKKLKYVFEEINK